MAAPMIVFAFLLLLSLFLVSSSPSSSSIDSSPHSFPDLISSDISLQLRLSLTTQNGGVFVTWTTPGAVSSPMVLFGLSASSMSQQSISPLSDTYGTSFFHTVTLPGLTPSTRYFYQVVDDQTEEPISEVHSFMTPPPEGKMQELRIGVVGDLGTAYDSNQTSIAKGEYPLKDGSALTMVQMFMMKNTTDFFLHVGDISYADDYFQIPNRTYEGTWQMWQNLMAPLTSEKIYMTLPGNHEVTCNEVTPFLCPPSLKNFTAYRHRFHMPGNETGGFEDLWYSFDYGMAHFIQLDTETDYPGSKMGPGSYDNNPNIVGDTQQTAWLKADLAKASANRAQVPWIIVSGHRPFYGRKIKGNCDTCKVAFEELLIQHNVDLYISGHVHEYERMYPLGLNGSMPNGESYDNPSVPVYIINGAGGSIESYSHISPNDPNPVYSAVFLKEFGLGELILKDAENLVWNYYNAANHTIVDTFSLFKKRSDVLMAA